MQGRTQQMLIGFNAPTAGPLSAADNLAKIVVGGEAMGFDYATFSDHVVIPTAIAAEYPYSASGEFPSGTRGERHEQLTEVTWMREEFEAIDAPDFDARGTVTDEYLRAF